ncbi:hypothetical protein Pla52o_10680 [Novipirellula galeiformis]|uniref:Uncharacterized protein n=1 Tax=Novipirellula galeiformis TaxID=2528004 RepID=A0A5C6CU71_9BACT|nr:hypothetical protein [Novipirellula galeiformis]TWU27204.1 hypothetical protein Pla52o_10680 [Novipirellula galeiformis]
MKNVVIVLMNLIVVTTCGATDWLTLPSKYSHDPVTLQRVAQFQPAATPAVPESANFRTSGYTHVRSNLNYGQSSDNYHRVETWGDPVRPYGEWQYPFRPYSVPYAAWGAPFAGMHVGPYGNAPFGNVPYGQADRREHSQGNGDHRDRGYDDRSGYRP